MEGAVCVGLKESKGERDDREGEETLKNGGRQEGKRSKEGNVTERIARRYGLESRERKGRR